MAIHELTKLLALTFSKQEHVKLRRVQLREDALAVNEEIGQSISGFDVLKLVVSVLAQRMIAIGDPDLRDQRKHALTHRFEARHKTGNWRKDSGAKKTHEPARPGGQLKHAIG